MRSQLKFCVTVMVFILAPAAAWTQEQQPVPATQQSPAANPAPPAQGTSTAASRTKPRKVWTNDEVESLRKDGISVVGNRPLQNRTAAAPKGDSQERDPAWYRNQLLPLQSEMKSLDGEIEKTKSFLSGEKVSDETASIRSYYFPSGSPQEQLKQLEVKRDKDAAKVEDLLDKARQNGIDPGALQ